MQLIDLQGASIAGAGANVILFSINDFLLAFGY